MVARFSLPSSSSRTHEFIAIKSDPYGWYVCLAGREGLGTSYDPPAKGFNGERLRFATKRTAEEFKREYLVKPSDYWIAPAGKYTISNDGKLVPCHKSLRADQRMGLR